MPNSPLKHRLLTVRDALLDGLVERDLPVRLALLAALAGEHLLLLGPPGTAKSEVARRLRGAFQDATYFERLLTRFSVPEELFGPLSIKALEEDRYRRLTKGYLPEATFAFLDEIFKANSAILNALLTLLNEREFDNGEDRVKTPLLCVVAASNELPEGEELHALYDRFLLRCHVQPVSDAGFERLLALRGDGPPTLQASLRLSPPEVEQVRAEVRNVRVPSEVTEMLRALRVHLAEQQIYVSDRRFRKIVRLLQTAAFTDGRAEVSIWDSWLLRYCTWDQPEQEASIADWYTRRVGAASAMDPERFVKLAQTWELASRRDAESQSQSRDEHGQLLYVDDKKLTTSPQARRQKQNAKGEPLYLAPAHRANERTNNGVGYTDAELDSNFFGRHHYRYNSRSDDHEKYIADKNNWLYEDVTLPPAMEPTRYSKEHIEGRVRQVQALHADVDRHRQGIEARIESIHRELRAHLWVDPSFADTAASTLEQSRSAVLGLLKDLANLTRKFENLPQRKEP
jgi:MoxR-like ATPase